jgi:glutathione S-transferase
MFLELYIDPLSQPARALMLFVRAAKIECQEKNISIMKGEHKTPEYAKVNAFQKIPAIIHDGFHLAESIAIFRYLARTFPVDDHWYPKDSRKQARVDEFLAWHHIGLRMPMVRCFLSILMPERLGDVTPTEKDIENYRKGMGKALDDVESIFLEKNNFVAGDEITIADLMAVGEIQMSRLINYDPREGRPKLAAYLSRVRATLGTDLFDEVHATLIQFAEVTKAKLAK